MPSFDIVSRTDVQEIDNAVNNTRKAILQRFDFRGAKAEIELDRKACSLKILTEDGSKAEAIREMFRSAAVKRGLDLKAFDWGEKQDAAGGTVRVEVKVRQGLEGDLAKDIVKRIKASGLKVQASILGDEVRATAKKIDDLQAVIAMLKESDFPAPLQFVNMKS